jgi:hypothetical protein
MTADSGIIVRLGTSSGVRYRCVRPPRLRPCYDFELIWRIAGEARFQDTTDNLQRITTASVVITMLALRCTRTALRGPVFNCSRQDCYAVAHDRTPAPGVQSAAMQPTCGDEPGVIEFILMAREFSQGPTQGEMLQAVPIRFPATHYLTNSTASRRSARLRTTSRIARLVDVMAEPADGIWLIA